jgi:hypothetical protein
MMAQLLLLLLLMLSPLLLDAAFEMLKVLQTLLRLLLLFCCQQQLCWIQTQLLLQSCHAALLPQYCCKAHAVAVLVLLCVRRQ